MEIRRLLAGTLDHHVALHRALDLPIPAQRSRPARPVANLLEGARQGRVSLDLCLGAFDRGRMTAACVGVEAPGRAALVLISSCLTSERGAQALALSLEALQDLAWERRIAFLEILMHTTSPALREALCASGFRLLTRLIYLSRALADGAAAAAAHAGAGALEWVTYSPGLKDLFEEAVRRTYVQSMDCPELTDLRPISDVLAGHRATGVFDPARWWAVCRHAEPVGVILQNRIPTEQTVEVVYMGVAQAARRTGVASAMLRRAIAAGAILGDRLMSLAVDARNVPARGLYERAGFVQTADREAWIATPEAPKT